MEGFEGAVRYCLPRNLPLQEQMGCHTGPGPRGLPGSERRGSGGRGDPKTEPTARGPAVGRCPLERVGLTGVHGSPESTPGWPRERLFHLHPGHAYQLRPRVVRHGAESGSRPRCVRPQIEYVRRILCRADINQV
jgi:hypothetical protein